MKRFLAAILSVCLLSSATVSGFFSAYAEGAESSELYRSERISSDDKDKLSEYEQVSADELILPPTACAAALIIPILTASFSKFIVSLFFCFFYLSVIIPFIFPMPIPFSRRDRPDCCRDQHHRQYTLQNQAARRPVCCDRIVWKYAEQRLEPFSHVTASRLSVNYIIKRDSRIEKKEIA